MAAFNAQQAVRQNASELSEYLSDLKSWGNKMEQKEQKSKETKASSSKSIKDKNLPPIRNQSKAAADLEQNTKIASKYKAEGNEKFKAGQYKEAIECYSKAIDAMPENAVLYSNRAMAKLKAKEFEDAEADCSQCIELDSVQIKAWFRRGLARKALKKYNKALADFEMAYKLDPNNKAAKKEKIEMKKKLDQMYKKSKQKMFAPSKVMKKTKKEIGIREKRTRKIVIEECDESDTDSSVDGKEKNMKKGKMKEMDLKNDTNDDEKVMKCEEFKMEKVPLNFIEFEKLWSRAANEENRSLILLALKDKKINKIIKNMMDDTLFSQMISTIHYILMQVEVKDGLIILKQLTKMDRFEMIVMFMTDNDQKLIKEMKQRCVESNLNIKLFDKFA